MILRDLRALSHDATFLATCNSTFQRELQKKRAWGISSLFLAMQAAKCCVASCKKSKLKCILHSSSLRSSYVRYLQIDSLCTRGTERALEITLIVEFHRITRSLRRTMHQRK